MKKPSQVLIGFAIEAAEGFRTAGLKSAPTKNSGPTVLSDLASGAVNLSLALELFLKTLILECRIQPNTNHNLKGLYNQIPQATQNSIEKLYRQLLDANPEEESELTIKGFHYSNDPQELRNRNFRPDTANPDLETLLESHADTFVLWRYIHEIREPRFSYFYDFRSINAAIDAVRIHAIEAARELGLLISMNESAPPANWGSENLDERSE